ncbi:hypothetical protein EVJ58_g10907 [Rhodofomes roseus]|uniref:Uncharacterized protein n=1 Tax=Rhodofomes roseus TaxID=34475 RepID=A0A4Y9XN01_9APHY|nr:hypothetical protein EVJ58_g10907 [Rhodofomes roseus]
MHIRPSSHVPEQQRPNERDNHPFPEHQREPQEMMRTLRERINTLLTLLSNRGSKRERKSARVVK